MQLVFQALADRIEQDRASERFTLLRLTDHISAPAFPHVLHALGALARMGLYVEPTCAAAAAGLTQWLASGVIRTGETTVVVLTGSGLKSSERIGQLLNLQPRTM